MYSTRIKRKVIIRLSSSGLSRGPIFQRALTTREAKLPQHCTSRQTPQVWESWVLGTSPRMTPVGLKHRGFAKHTGAGWSAAAGPILILLLALSAPAYAVEPSEILKDPKLEARAREISQKLRCVVCQNQSIDDSSAPLAKDLRVLVRERLTAGDTNSQTIGFIVARYGNFVLLKPPMQINTLLLWLGPLLLAGLAFFGFSRLLKRQHQQMTTPIEPPLSAEEQARVQALMEPEAKAAQPAQGNA
jgi:cytochrome c-type biogenesis protein CcmH